MSFQIYTHGRRDQNKIALTFDDGPNPPRTDQVLEILASRGVRGTFFVMGKWVDRYPKAFERMVSAGHVIGNHSYMHDPDLCDFDRAEAALSNFTGRPTAFLRAPYFHYHLCLQSSVALAPSTKIVDSDVNPRDYAQQSLERIVRDTIDHPSLQGGSIIDLHDGSETENDASRLSRPLPMIAALPRIIDVLKDKGFTFVGLDELELVDATDWTPSFGKSSLSM